MTRTLNTTTRYLFSQESINGGVSLLHSDGAMPVLLASPEKKIPSFRQKEAPLGRVILTKAM